MTLHRVEYDRAVAVAAAREREFSFGWESYAEALETGFWNTRERLWSRR